MSGLVKVTLSNPKMVQNGISHYSFASVFSLKHSTLNLILSLLIGFTYHEVCCVIWNFLAIEKPKYIKAKKWPNLPWIELFFKVPILALAFRHPLTYLNIYVSQQSCHLHNQHS